MGEKTAGDSDWLSKTHRSDGGHMWTSVSSENQTSNFNALSTRSILRGPWVDKGRVRCSSDTAPFLVTIIALEEQPLGGCHAAPVPPSLVWTELDGGRLSGAIGIPMLNPDQFLVTDAGSIGHGQWEADDGSGIQGSPDVDETDSTLLKTLGFVRILDMKRDSSHGRGGSLIDMHPPNRSARRFRRRTSDRVVENDNLVSPRELTEDELFHLGIIFAFNLAVVEEIGQWIRLARHIGERGERVSVETNLVLMTTCVVDFHVVFFVAKVAWWHPFRRLLHVIEWCRAILRRSEE